jgi:hypothetical protein
MEPQRVTKAQLQKRLRALRQDYEDAKQRVQEIGFISQGSLTERRLPCGNPNCRCHTDPNKGHGPYFQLSWKDQGKTVSHFLPADLVSLYREWLGNRHALMAIIDEMQAISRDVSDCIRALHETGSKP